MAQAARAFENGRPTLRCVCVRVLPLLFTKVMQTGTSGRERSGEGAGEGGRERGRVGEKERESTGGEGGRPAGTVAPVGVQVPSPHRVTTYIMLVFAALCALAQAEQSQTQTVLGRLHHTCGPIHSMDRSELEAELRDRGARHISPAETDDMLRLKVCNLRNQLLTHRNNHAMHAQTVMHEVEIHSTIEFLSDLSLDTILADDNAVFSHALSRKLLWQLQLQASVGAMLGLVLCKFPLFGRIQPGMGILTPRNRRWGYGALTVATSTLLALLAAAREYLRGLAGAPSFFGQKATAVTCREGLVEWLGEVVQEQQQQQQQQQQQRMLSGGAPASPASPSELAAEAASDPRLLLRRGIYMPILYLCCGSSIFEEVTYRGILLHALVTKLRLPPLVASGLSSAIFGLAHLGNDRGAVLKAIYAGWTFCGGLIFGEAYLGTRGGFLLPIALHFVNNAIVFGASVRKVARKMLHEFYEYQELTRRSAAAPQTAAPLRGGAGGGGGGFAGGGGRGSGAGGHGGESGAGGGAGAQMGGRQHQSLFDVDQRWARLRTARQGEELFLLNG